jgi:hypothetical protein
MTKQSLLIREKFVSVINHLEQCREKYVVNPAKDFTRNRKLSFSSTLAYILGLKGESLQDEILSFVDYNADKLMTSSAVIQARSKFKLKLFKDLFENSKFQQYHHETYKGYRIFAHDGSDINLPIDDSDSETFIDQKYYPHNILHLNAFYDVQNKRFEAIELQGTNVANERGSLCDMVKSLPLPEKSIITSDRGYEGYNVCAHILEAGQDFVIRIRDFGNRLGSTLPLPEADEYDEVVSFQLTRGQTNAIKKDPNFVFVPATSTFDYLPQKYNGETYPMTLRFARFKISEDTYELLITSLEREKFSTQDLKNIYHLRWGIETAFRELKYALELVDLHSRKKELILQELYAKVIMYNFAMQIAMEVHLEKNECQYDYQINFTRAFKICRQFFKDETIDVETLILSYILPIRPNRKDKRHLKVKTFGGFLYRAG